MLAPLLPDLRPPLTFSHSLLFSHPQLFSSAADSLQGGPALPLLFSSSLSRHGSVLDGLPTGTGM